MTVERYTRKTRCRELKDHRKTYPAFLPFYLTENGTRTFLFSDIACEDETFLRMGVDERRVSPFSLWGTSSELISLA